MKKNYAATQYIYLLGVILFLVAFSSIVYYQLTGLKLDFYHESAFPLLYAQTNLETLLPYSPRFSGREIAPITWPLLQSIPLLFGAKVSVHLHAITSVIFTLFTLFCCFLYCKVNKFSKFTSIFFSTLIYISFVLPPSTYSWLDQVWVWPMNSYGIYDFFSLICLSLLINYIDNNKKINKGLYALLAVYFLFGLNGTRSLIMVTFPAIFGLSAYLLSTQDPLNRNKWFYWYVVLGVGVATVAGSILTKLIWHDIPQPFQDPQKVFGLNSREEFRDKLSFFIHTWLTLFDGLPKSGSSMFSFEGIRHITNSIFSITILTIPFVRFLKNQKSSSELITTYRFVFILLIIFIANIYGNASLSVRYLIPLAYSALFIVPFYFEDWIKLKKYGYIILIIALLVPAYITSVYSLTRYNATSYKSNRVYQLSNFLESKQLTYGYGGPFESNILAVNQFSNAKVHLAILDTSPLREHTHGDKIWYHPDNHKGITFVVFPSKFWSENKELQVLTRHSIERLQFEDWVIYVFKDNIFNKTLHGS